MRDRLLEHGDEALASVGTYLVDVEVGFSKARAMLRFFIDWDDDDKRVTVEDCSRSARALRSRIEDYSLVGGEYGLEVSSPGIERRIALARDFVRFANARVRLKLRNPIDGQRNLDGIITNPDGRGFEIVSGDSKIHIDYDNVARGNLVYEF